MNAKVILCGSIVLVLFVLNVQSTGGGQQGPIIIKSSGRKNRNRDMFMIGASTKCGNGPIIAKSGGRKRQGNDMIMLGGAQCHEEKKKEIIPVPYPVKQMVHVPVPYKETVHVPVHIPVHIPMPVKEEYGSMGGYGGGDMGSYGGGMEMGGYGGGYARRR